MVPGVGWPVSYVLLCGQAALLLGNLLLLQGVSRSHQHNATGAESGDPGEAEPDQPAGSPAPACDYGDPLAPLVLCTYL
ncbi:hypothetical protein KIL84_010850 [Mauremys mutica]|uniref:Uncharacterized protein n=2 Tax=Mauremys mutica TaxID=74926 RepID=A0A9D4B0F6_9SAUR|nr:hypothetical protein KIL84_010850 [Mauremys mutica]